MKKFFTVLTSLLFISSQAQENTVLSFNAYMEAYYSYSAYSLESKQNPVTDFNHRRTNQFGLNLGLIDLQFKSRKTRGALGLMSGDYSTFNLAHEPIGLSNLYEAYMGYQIIEGLWIDAGVFSSHLGFESAIGSENMTLTRTLVAESSPYYLSGIKATYEKLEKWTFQLSLSNGWQNMVETNWNTNKAIGTQIAFKPNKKWNINYSTFTSNEYPDVAKRWRFFNDFYIQKESDKLSFTLACDYGIEEDGVNGWNNWTVLAAIAQYHLNENFSSAIRYEHAADRDAIAISSSNGTAFNGNGASLNLDFHPGDSFMFRIEPMYRWAAGNYFSQKGDYFGITTSMCLKIN